MVNARNLIRRVHTTIMFKTTFFICIFSAILLTEFSAENSDRFRSLNFQVRHQSDIEGTAPLALRAVMDKLSCMFFCLLKSECLTTTLSRTTNDNGEFQCTAYSVPLGIMGTKLVASALVDLYEPFFEGWYVFGIYN